jgi:isopentenyldiphosphate isomerase
MTIEMLDVVDENDNVVGTAPRTEIHQKGLLHREINVVFITPTGDLIFQRRSKTKDTYPDMLDATAGGHVEIGDSYDETAVKEIKEETGLDVSADDLVLFGIVRSDAVDEVTNMRNNCHRAIYGYVYTGELKDLIIEDNAAQGFETYAAGNMFTMSDNLKAQFVGRWVDAAESKNLYDQLIQLIQK